MTDRAIGDRTWRVLTWLYLGGILSANAMAAKLIGIGGVTLTAGALAIPLVYITTDLLNELYGPGPARAVVWMGLGASAVLVAMSLICSALPASPLGAPQSAFLAIFSTTPRIVAASMLAYLTSSLLDVRLFALIKRWTGQPHFWLRKNGSTVVSQFVDTALFVLVAFSGVVPWPAIPGMIGGQYLVKIAAAPLGTPLSYLVLRVAR